MPTRPAGCTWSDTEPVRQGNGEPRLRAVASLLDRLDMTLADMLEGAAPEQRDLLRRNVAALVARSIAFRLPPV